MQKLAAESRDPNYVSAQTGALQKKTTLESLNGRRQKLLASEEAKNFETENSRTGRQITGRRERDQSNKT